MAKQHLTTYARNLRRNQTDAEKLLWKHLRTHRFSGIKFLRQQPVGRFIVDFVTFNRGVVIEVDGGQHGQQNQMDRKRDDWFCDQGYTVLRFWNNEIFTNIDAVLMTIEQSINRPSPPIKGGEE